MAAFSPSADRNRYPIAETLQVWLGAHDRVLEIGSGTGQHAVYFSEMLSFAEWQTSDLPDMLAAIESNLNAASQPRLARPIKLDVTDRPWPVEPVDVIFTVNTCHIVTWRAVCAMFSEAALRLRPGGRFIVYGPFFIADGRDQAGNLRFDRQLRAGAPGSGIRDLDRIEALGSESGLQISARYAMPANNTLLVFTVARTRAS